MLVKLETILSLDYVNSNNLYVLPTSETLCFKKLSQSLVATKIKLTKMHDCALLMLTWCKVIPII